MLRLGSVHVSGKLPEGRVLVIFRIVKERVNVRRAFINHVNISIAGVVCNILVSVVLWVWNVNPWFLNDFARVGAYGGCIFKRHRAAPHAG